MSPTSCSAARWSLRTPRPGRSKWPKPARRCCFAGIRGITSFRTGSTSSACSSSSRHRPRLEHRASTRRPGPRWTRSGTRTTSSWGAGRSSARNRRFTTERASDILWRRDGDALVGITVSTEHLTVGTLSLLPGQHSDTEQHGGDETMYVLEGVLNVRTWSDGSEGGTSFIRATASTVRRARHIGTATSAAASPGLPSGSPHGGASATRDRGRCRCDQGGRGTHRSCDREAAAIGELPGIDRGRGSE